MPVVLNEPPAPPAPSDPPPERRPERRAVGRSTPRRWPALLLVSVLVAGITAIAVSSCYDRRSPGEKIDATVQGLRERVDAVFRGSAAAGDRAATALGDTGITASVKAALAADPALSMLKIEVNTEGGVVTLSGPAPDERARQRAAVLAAAPAGVVRVDNRLVIAPPPAAASR